ncbi:MAG: IS1380 family transposase [Verrucomicrobiales bacterium]|nr:IS1380 family transposase [Verrucomicrobiales bacterium]
MQTNKRTATTTVDATECSRQPLLFPELISRPVKVDFQAGFVSSDGGGLLLARLDRGLGHLRRFSRCFTDHRDPECIEHTVEELLRQRVYGLALGYEDLNDHEQLKHDPLLAAMCGKRDPLGRDRVRVQDQGKALAGKSTLNRLELTPANACPSHRYKKIVAEEGLIEDWFIAEYVRSLKRGRTQPIVLDLDATDDPLHGHQEGRFFHGYYGHYCYLPLYIFAGHWPVWAQLRPANIDASAGAREAVEKIVRAIRQKLPQVKIVLRADSGFCRDELMSWCEENGVDYLFGIARNAVLERELESSLEAARQQAEVSETKSARVFHQFHYKAKKWAGAKRRVIGKAEWTAQGRNPRFIITSLAGEARRLYERDYCARGEMENRIKEQQQDLFADRTSTAGMRSNQLRLWFATLAYLLLHRLRQIGLKDTGLARASCGSIRLKLLKIGALVRVSVRRVQVSLSSAYPLQGLFGHVARRVAFGSG